MKIISLCSMLLICLTGCSSFNGTRLEGLLGADENLIALSYKIADTLEENAVPHLMPRNPEQPVLTTTFVDNTDLEQTSTFGRVLQEHITSRLVQHGYTVHEIKMRETLLIREKSGETILSRDLKLIKPSVAAQAVLVGTYSYANRKMYISARLINPDNSVIISSMDYQLVMDDTILAMFGLQVAKDDPYVIKRPKESMINKIFY